MSWRDWAALEQSGDETNTSVYSGCGKRVAFVAAAHSNEADSETHRQVRAAFGAASAQFAIAEGFPTALGRSPETLLRYALDAERTPGDFEPLLTIRLAAAAGAPFVGGEPVDSEILTAVAAQGVGAADLFGHYVVRQIDQWVQSGEASSSQDPIIAELIGAYAARFAEETGVGLDALVEVSAFGAFRRWYERTNGVPYATGFRPEDAWPSSPATNRRTNHISNPVADVRDRHLQRVMAGALREFDRVLIVYGASHHSIHAPALEAAFGKPTSVAQLGPSAR